MINDILKKYPKLKVPVIDGEVKLVYEPDPAKPNTWMVNDHCFIRDGEGVFHYFGIENPFPSTAQALGWLSDLLKPTETPFIQTLYKLMSGHLYHVGTHYRIGHATADHPLGPWTRRAAALDGGKARSMYGSPFVVEHQDRYWMLLPEGEPGAADTGLYVSRDLNAWQSVRDATPWQEQKVFDGVGHRDPCVVKLPDGTFLQYFAGNDARCRNTIGLASSRDLKSWERCEPCYVENIPNAPVSGIFESPFMFQHEQLYYLFVGFSHRHYYETFVVVSDTPRRFEPENKITTLFTHAAELIACGVEVYLSSCGIEDPQRLNHSGIWLSKLKWMEP